MDRKQLEHIVGAAGALTRVTEWVVLDATGNVAVMFAPEHPWAAKMVSASIGEGSTFHKRFGYCARGVKAAVLPWFWRQRAASMIVRGTLGTCVSAADAAIARLVAGEEAELLDRDLLQELKPSIARRISALDTGRTTRRPASPRTNRRARTRDTPRRRAPRARRYARAAP
jgi:hypothetical protein